MCWEGVAGLPKRQPVFCNRMLLATMDRDGIVDALDADHDNDDISDLIERLQGTDVLDGTSR